MTTAQFLRNMLLAALAFALTFVMACGEDPTARNGDFVDDNNNGVDDNNGHDNNGIADNNGGYVPGFEATIHVIVPEEMVGEDTYVHSWEDSRADCQGQSECDLKTNFQGVNTVSMRTPFWLAIPKEVMVDRHGMTVDVTWDNTETPGQYGLAPVGTYRDPLDHDFVVDFKTEVLTYEWGEAVGLGSRQLPYAATSGNRFEWLEAEAPASFTGTISDDLRVITIREVTGNGTVFENTLEIVGDPIDPVTGQPYKKNP